MVDHRGWDNVEPTAPVAGACALSWLLFRRFWLSGPFACPIGPGRTRSRPLKGWPPVRQTCAPFARRARPSRGPSPPCPSLGAQSGTADEPPSRSKVAPKSPKTRAVLPSWRSSYRCGFDGRPVPTANTRLAQAATELLAPLPLRCDFPRIGLHSRGARHQSGSNAQAGQYGEAFQRPAVAAGPVVQCPRDQWASGLRDHLHG